MSSSPVEVWIDSREKRPLLFPATLRLRGRTTPIVTIRKRLPEGDYCLADSPEVCLVERKGSAREIRENFLGADRHRALRALKRLSKASKRPILLLEVTASELLTPTRYIETPGPLVQEMLDTLASLRIEVLLPGACNFPTKRRRLGEFIVRLMLASKPA
jgi:hypothetical protein